MIHLDDIHIFGDVDAIVEYSDGRPTELHQGKNAILRTGRAALAAVLTSNVGDTFGQYVNRMIFGTNGTAGGVPKYVTDDRSGLFGLTVLSKPVVASVDPNSATTAIFTSVVAYGDANSLTLNEMALQMANGDLYSMRTFPDLNKTSTMQITFNWRINFV